MVSARWIAVALAALAFGVGGVKEAAAQAPGTRADAQPSEQASSKFNPLVRRGSPLKPGADGPTAAEKPSKAAASQPTPPAAAPQGSNNAAAAIAIGPSAPAPPASPVAVETVASTPAAGKTPLGLSGDAPDKAPSIGVIGGGNGTGKGSRSVAPTPEPSTLLLMGAGLAGIYRLRRRK